MANLERLEEDEMPVSLQGFIIDLHTVSEENLNVELDCSHLPWSEYKALIEGLEDALTDIDERHSVRSWLTRGRGLKARYRRVTAEDRRRILRFSPFPSKFANLLKNTRTYLYQLMTENCLVLEEVGRRKVWLLPKSLAPFFVEAVDRINAEVIDPLIKDMEEFKASDDYLKIIQILHSHKADPTALRVSPFTLGRFRADILPVDFGYSIDVDETYEKMRRTEAAKGLEILKRQIERRQREYVLSAVSDVVERIVEMAEALEGRGRRLRNAEEKMDKLMEICSSLGLKEVNERVLKPLKEICRSRSYKRERLSQELFGKPSLKEGVNEVLKDLLHLDFGGKEILG